jgi:GNAT superfamily N-acetyltransferase
MDITVRKGHKEDLPAVLSLIKELAEFERAAQDVVITLEDMERDGFGAEPVFGFFVAEHQNSIIGMALYYIKYSTWKGKCIFLEDLIVTEKYRRYKVGSKLFETVLQLTKQMGFRRFEWQVLDWNTAAIEFYKKYNTQFLNEWLNCRLTEEQLGNLRIG